MLVAVLNLKEDLSSIAPRYEHLFYICPFSRITYLMSNLWLLFSLTERDERGHDGQCDEDD
jgi:hypothetical protein